MKKIISWFLCITMLAGCLVLGGCTQSAKSGSSADRAGEMLACKVAVFFTDRVGR